MLLVAWSPSEATLPHWETSLLTPWPDMPQSHYPNIVITSPYPILLMLSTRLGSDAYQSYKSLVCLGWEACSHNLVTGSEQLVRNQKRIPLISWHMTCRLLYFDLRALNNHLKLPIVRPYRWLLLLGLHRTMMMRRMMEKSRCQKASSTQISFQSWGVIKANMALSALKGTVKSPIQLYLFIIITIKYGYSQCVHGPFSETVPHFWLVNCWSLTLW